jgi:polysaccharide export outer membrane protein
MKWRVLLLALTVAGCSSPRLVDTGRISVVSAEALPAPTHSDLVGPQRPHLIGPFDRIAVEVFALPDLSRTVQVDSNGQISLPVAGVIDVNGRTPMEVAALVEERLRAGFVRDPRVGISIVETVSQTVTVDGEVDMPGIYPVAGRMTLMRAIARAQGTSELANSGHVVIFRTINGQRMAALYDLRAIRLAAYEDPEIYPNDLVVVGESQARRLFPQILQAAGLILTPLITVLDRN